MIKAGRDRGRHILSPIRNPRRAAFLVFRPSSNHKPCPHASIAPWIPSATCQAILGPTSAPSNDRREPAAKFCAGVGNPSMSSARSAGGLGLTAEGELGRGTLLAYGELRRGTLFAVGLTRRGCLVRRAKQANAPDQPPKPFRLFKQRHLVLNSEDKFPILRPGVKIGTVDFECFPEQNEGISRPLSRKR